MGTPPVANDVLAATVEAYNSHGGNQVKAADSLGISRGALQDRLKKAARIGLMGTKPVLDGFEISKTTAVTDQSGNVVREFIQQKPERDLSSFNMPAGHEIKGVSAYLDADGNVVGQWVKTREGQLSVDALADAVKASFIDWTPPPFPVPGVGDTDADTLTIYPLADMHLGLRAVADEAGSDFDLGIAAARFRNTTSRLFDRSPNSDTALILQLGDWTHVDDDLALTPTSKNTLQVSDRLLDIARCGVGIMVDYIYHALRKHRQVIVKVLKGNHDLNAWLALYIGLCEHFRDNERVTIDGGAADYWFFRFGKNLIGAHHGHRLKPAEMAGAMAMECREDWGETLYRLFLHGHLHHLMVKEVLGVRVECMRTIAEEDAHHAGKYRAGKSLVSITLHRENGEDGRAQINLPPVSKRAVRAA